MVISSSADVFFQQNMYANYGERSECWDWSLLLYTELTIRLLGTRYCSRRLGSRCQEACWWFSGDDLGRQFSALDSCLCRNLAMSLASINFLKHFHTFLTGCVQDEQAHWLDRGHAKIRRKFPRVPSSVWQRVKTCGSHEWGKCGVKMWHNTLFLSLNILVSFHRWDPSQSLAGSSAKTPSWPFLKLSKKYHAGMMRCGFLKPYTTFPPHPCWRWTVYHRSDKLFAYNSVMDQLADAQVKWNLCVDIAHIKIEQYDLFCWMRSGQTHRMLEVSVALHFAIWEGWNSSGRISHYMCVNRSFLRCFSWCTSGWQHGCGTFKAQYRTFTSEACQRYRWGELLGLYTVFSCLHFRSLPKFSPLVQIAGEDCRTGCVSSCERRCQ